MADAARQSRYLKKPDDHYLKKEFHSLMQSRGDMHEFLLRDAFDGIRFWDLENREHEWISPGFWRALGYAPEAMPHITAACRGIVDPSDFKKAMSAFEKHCADRRHPDDQTVRYKHADGHTVWFRCRGAAIRDNEDTPIRMLTTFTDITDLKTREQKLADACAQLKQRTDQLEANNQGLKDFAAIVAHDLNSPLRQATMQLSLLDAEIEKAAPGDSGREAIDGVNATLDRMRRIVKSMHELYRINAFDLDLRPTPIDAVINDAITQSNEYLESRSARVNVAQMPVLAVDPDLVTKIFRHLLVNACKHSDADALSIDITHEYDRARERVLIYVDDNGSGVPEKCEEKIFEPYKRLAQTDGDENSGIGLALCRRMMMLHHGTAYVDPHFENGARFVLSFPDAEKNDESRTVNTTMHPSM